MTEKPRSTRLFYGYFLFAASSSLSALYLENKERKTKKVSAAMKSLEDTWLNEVRKRSKLY